MVQIYSKYVRPKTNDEPGGGKSLIEKGSHVPVMQQVRDMIAAGERLGESRKGAFDFDEGEEVPKDVLPDPTRSSNFDLADATRISEEIAEAQKARENVQVQSAPEVKPAEAVDEGKP